MINGGNGADTLIGGPGPDVSSGDPELTNALAVGATTNSGAASRSLSRSCQGLVSIGLLENIETT